MRTAAAALLVLFVTAALPAAPNSHRNEAEDAYILAIGDTWSSGGADVDELVRMGKRGRGDFLWFRRAGKVYRVTDGATIAKADAFFGPLRALDPEIEEFGARSAVSTRRVTSSTARRSSSSRTSRISMPTSRPGWR